MASRAIYDVYLDDERNVAVVEWDVRVQRRHLHFREVLVVHPDRSPRADQIQTAAKCQIGRAEEVLSEVDGLDLPEDVRAEVVERLRGGVQEG